MGDDIRNDQSIQEWATRNLRETTFKTVEVALSFQKDHISLIFFKGCLLQILLGLLLNKLSHISL